LARPWRARGFDIHLIFNLHTTSQTLRLQFLS